MSRFESYQQKKLIRLETLKGVCFQGGSKYRDIDDDGDKNYGGGHSKYKNSGHDHHKRRAFKV